MKKARIINEVATDVCVNPVDLFHPSILSEFVEIPDNVSEGYRLENGIWSPPDEKEAYLLDSSRSLKLSPFEFKLLFAPNERVSINEAKANDPLVSDFFAIIEDPRMTVVDLALQSTKDIINHLVTVNIITKDRSVDILAAKPV